MYNVSIKAKGVEIMAEEKAKAQKPKENIQYVRQQKGHSILLAIFFGWISLYILPVYWTVSKDHYWHL